MKANNDLKTKIAAQGFAIIDDVYTSAEIENVLDIIAQADTLKPTFRRTTNLFAIRQFLKEVPDAAGVLFNHKLKTLISEIFGPDYFVVKSIYFDKPEGSNWFVAYHQDLTISVDKKCDLEGFGPWTVKQAQYAVQPPLQMLEQNMTARIHLDDTDENNGALKVISQSHLKGIYRPETINWTIEKETVCCVKKGGIMIMKPLLLHASDRTTDNRKRRVVHIEFSNQTLPGTLNWAEFFKDEYL